MSYRTYRSFGYRVNARPLGGGVRFEVEDFIQLAWHNLTGPTPRQSVVATLQPPREAINREPQLSGDRGNSRPHAYYCPVTEQYHGIPRLWHRQKNNCGRNANFGHQLDRPTSKLRHRETQREEFKTSMVVL